MEHILNTKILSGPTDARKQLFDCKNLHNYGRRLQMRALFKFWAGQEMVSDFQWESEQTAQKH